MYVLKQVTKTYSHRQGPINALDQVSLQIEEGSFLTITGPSGSGKTTLLFTIGGLIRPTSGHVLYNGSDLCGYSNAELANYRNQKIGFVLQSFHLIPYLSAMENVMVPALFANGKQQGSEKRAINLLAQMGLSERISHLPRELSVGQQQRVAIARALVNDPEVILADEPTGNLDPALSVEILEVLSELNENEGRTIIMVTHSPDAARFGKMHLKLNSSGVVSDI